MFHQHSQKRFVVTQYPQAEEEYFERIDLLEAVTTAQGQFTMIELGAGFGRWLVNAVTALCNYNDLPCQLIGVEAEPTHFQWMKTHFRDNGLDPDEHQLIQAAVSHQGGKIRFLMGRPYESYGQAVVSTRGWLRSLLLTAIQ